MTATAWSRAADILAGEQDPLAHLDPLSWNRTVIPSYFFTVDAPHHVEFWEWTETITPADPPDPFLAFWPRGHAKSSCAETAVVKIGCRRLRRYAWYVSDTQDQADDHVANIGSILESDGVHRFYPEAADRAVTKFGSSKGWRRNRLRTASGFTVDALGLDSARRGAKLEDQRPDVLVLDDVDDTHDTPLIVDRKLKSITRSLLPALTANAVVIMAQNLTHPSAIATRLASHELDILAGAVRSGPFPAVRGLRVVNEDGRWRVVGGEPTWAGMDLAECEVKIARYGMLAFEIESQQDISERPGALLKTKDIDRSRLESAPVDLDRVIVAIDPNQTGRNDDAGIVVIGRAFVNGIAHAYILEDLTETTQPEIWRDKAAGALISWGAGSFVIERTGLGDHARLTLKSAPALEGRPCPVEEVHASMSKGDRARPVAQLYRDGRVHHVGRHPVVESQWTTWEPDQSPWSPGGLDALVHGVTKLLLESGTAVTEPRRRRSRH